MCCFKQDKQSIKLHLWQLNNSPNLLTCENRKKLNKITVIEPFKVKT